MALIENMEEKNSSSSTTDLDQRSSAKSTTPGPETTHKSQVMAALFSGFPKKDERNFTVGAVVSDCPAEFDSFEQSKELHLNRLQF